MRSDKGSPAMRIFTVWGLVLCFVISGIAFSPVKAEEMPDPVIIVPNGDVFIDPDTVYPGVFGGNSGWFAYDHTPGFNSWYQELAYNDTSWPILFDCADDQDEPFEFRYEFEDIDLTWPYYSLKFYMLGGPNNPQFQFGFIDPLTQAGHLEMETSVGYFMLETNPLTGTYFTIDEINRMQGRLAGYKYGNSQWSWVYTQITVVPVEYTAPDYTYVLRPIMDYTDIDMEWTPKSEAYCFPEINETTPGGDFESTYMYKPQTWDEYTGANGTFVMSDLPLDAPRSYRYKITIWNIAWNWNHSAYLAVAVYRDGIDIRTHATDYWNDITDWHSRANQTGFEEFYVSSFPTNYTFELETNPRTGAAWTWYEINDLKVFLSASTIRWSESSLNVTQMGVLVEPVYIGDMDYGLGSSEPNIYSILWILFIFLPGIILGMWTPLGVPAGTVLMLIVFALTISGFYPVLIIGLAGIGVALYKGG